MGSTSYDTLRHGEKMVWAIQLLLWEVNTGGFDQYLTNSSGDLAQETIGYLDEIQAKATNKLLKEAAAVFPDEVIPSDRKKRVTFLISWQKKHAKKSTSLFSKLDRAFLDRTEDLTSLTLAYVRKHREDFA